MGPRGLGLPELVVILVIILLLFGIGRVSRVGRELGSAMGAFRKGLSESKDNEQLAEDDESKAG